MDSNSDTADNAVRKGSFKYLKTSVSHSLYRNGKVLTRRDGNGNDSAWEGVDLEERNMPVHDARQLEVSDRPRLNCNGLEVVESPLRNPNLNFLSQDEVIRAYYSHCAEIVQEVSGAAFVVAFDHNVRSATGKKNKSRIKGGQYVQGPAHVVHGDYTLTSAPQRLRDLMRPLGPNDMLSMILTDGRGLIDEVRADRALAGGRFAIINLWRNIAHEPVVTHPLAVCDAQSVRPEDLVVFEIHYEDRIGENYFAKHSDGHRWHFYSGLIRDEALLIKQWDSDGLLARSEGLKGDATGTREPCTFSFHSAFTDPTTPADAPDRWSIEVRCMAFYD